MLLLPHSDTQSLGPKMTANHTTVKHGNLIGSKVTVATLVYDFDRPLYRSWAPACAKGFCEAEPPDVNDPCFPGCDFTLKGDLCGTHPNPECDCSALRNQTGWCDMEYNWITLIEGEPSELFTLGQSGTPLFRFQHTKPCHAVSFHILDSASAPFQLFVSTLTPFVHGLNNLGPSSVPEHYLTVCPDHPQYQLGTWFMVPQMWQDIGSARVLVRTHDVSKPLPLPSPLPTCESPSADHTCILAGQSVYFESLPFSSPTRFVYTTSKCERVHLITQPTAHPPHTPVTYIMYDFDKEPIRPEQLNVAVNNLLFISLSVPITLCPAEGQDTVSLYISVGFMSIPDGIGMKAEGLFTIETENEFWETIPLKDSPKFMMWGNYRGAMEIHCGDREEDGGSEIVLYCRPGTEKFQGGCTLYRGFSSNFDNIGLENRMAILRNVDLQAFGPVNYNLWFDTVENRASFVFVLDYERAGTRDYFFQDWEQVLPTCRAKFLASGSFMHDEHGHWFEQEVPFRFIEPVCDANRFYELNQLVDDRLTDVNQFQHASDLFLVQTRRYSVDILTYADAWVGCTRFCEDLLEEETKLITLQGTRLCTNASWSDLDPCCNEDLAWESSCCLPRTTTVNLTALTHPREDVIEALCLKPQCTAQKVRDFSALALAVDTTQACSSVALQQAESTTERSLSFYTDCKSRHFGPVDSQGLRCVNDEDCITGLCDRTAGQCFYHRVEQERLFLTCLVEKASDSFRDSLSRFMGWDFSLEPEVLVDLLHARYSSMACVSDHSVWSPLRSHFVFPTAQYCPACSLVGNLYCLDESCPFPLWCGTWSRLRTNPHCASYWDLLEADPSRCGVAPPPACNWSPAITDAQECEAGASFCAFCPASSDVQCTVLTELGERAQCEQAVVCSLADGTLRSDLSAEQCEAAFRCSKRCPGGAVCQTREQCEEVGGSCHDSGYVLQLLEDSAIVDGPVHGYCLFENAPFNTPGCGSENLYNAVLDVGCVRYAECKNGDACTWINRERGECEAAGGTWVPREPSREQCELQRCDDYSIQLLTPKSAEECASCGGSMRKARQWESGRWEGGLVRAASWLEPMLRAQYRPEMALDFLQLFDAMKQAVNFEYHFHLQTELECYVNPLRNLVAELSCACGEESPLRTAEACFAPATPEVASARFCAGAINRVDSLSVHFSALPDSFVEHECAELTLALVSNRYFDPAPLPVIAAGLHRRISVPDPILHQTVYTHSGVLVGQVVGNGAEIYFTRGLLNTLWMCLSLIDIEVKENYTHPDFGLRVGQSSVRPLRLQISFDDTGRMCAIVPISSQRYTVIPIYRFPDAEMDSRSTVSAGELAVLWTVGSFFAVASLATMFCLVLHVVLTRRSWKNAVFWLMFWFLGTVVIRCVYLYLVAGQVLEASTTLLSFWLIDFPLITYLVGNMAIGVSFLFLLLRHRISFLHRPVAFHVTYAICSALLIAFFLAILVLFEFLVVRGEDAADFCTVQEGSTNAQQRSDSARALRLTYQCVVGLVAVLVGGMELILGLYLAFNSSLLLAMAITSSMGVICDSVAWVVYTAVDVPSPYFSLVLLFTEALPICVVLSLVARSTMAHPHSTISAESKDDLRSVSVSEDSRHTRSLVTTNDQ